MSIILKNTYIIDYTTYKNAVYVFMNIFLPDLRLATTPKELFNTVLMIDFDEKLIFSKFDKLFNKYLLKTVSPLRLKKIERKEKYEALLQSSALSITNVTKKRRLEIVHDTSKNLINSEFRIKESILGRFRLNLLKNFYHTNKKNYNKKFLGWVYNNKPIKSINKIVNKFCSTYINFKNVMFYSFSLAVQFRVLEMLGIGKEELEKNFEDTIDYGICSGLTNFAVDELDAYLIEKLHRQKSVAVNLNAVNVICKQTGFSLQSFGTKICFGKLYEVSKNEKIENPFLIIDKRIRQLIDEQRREYDCLNMVETSKIINLRDSDNNKVFENPRPNLTKIDKNRKIELVNSMFFLKNYMYKLKKKAVVGKLKKKDFQVLFDSGILSSTNENDLRIVGTLLHRNKNDEKIDNDKEKEERVKKNDELNESTEHVKKIERDNIEHEPRNKKNVFSSEQDKINMLIEEQKQLLIKNQIIINKAQLFNSKKNKKILLLDKRSEETTKNMQPLKIIKFKLMPQEEKEQELRIKIFVSKNKVLKIIQIYLQDTEEEIRDKTKGLNNQQLNKLLKMIKSQGIDEKTPIYQKLSKNRGLKIAKITQERMLEINEKVKKKKLFQAAINKDPFETQLMNENETEIVVGIKIFMNM